MFEMAPTGFFIIGLYLLFIIAVAVLVVLGIIALTLSIRLLRIRIAESSGGAAGPSTPVPPSA